MAKLDNSKVSKVSIPSLTLKAITEALKTPEGMDITPIVNALSIGRNPDLVAVQTILLLKGYSQEVDKASRYKVIKRENDYYPKCVIYRYDYVRTGIYDAKVQVNITVLYSDTSNLKSVSTEYKIGTVSEEIIDIEAWDSLPKATDLDKGTVETIEKYSMIPRN